MFDSNSFHALVAPFDGSTGVYLYVDDNLTDDLEDPGFWLASPAVPGDYVISRGHPERSSAIYRMGDDGTAVLVQRVRTDMINAVAPALAVLANAVPVAEPVYWGQIEGKPFGDLVSPDGDYADLTEATAAIKSIIDALQE